MANPAEQRSEPPAELPTRVPFGDPWPGADHSPAETPGAAQLPADERRLSVRATDPDHRPPPVPAGRGNVTSAWRIPVAAAVTAVLVGGAMWWSQDRTVPVSPQIAAGPASVATVRVTAPETDGSAAGAGIGSDSIASSTGLSASADPVASSAPATSKPAAPKPAQASANPSGRNLARGSRATSSSIERDVWAPANAVDEDETTRWSSGFSDPQWLTVDLGARYQISEVELHWENAYATAYRVEVSTDGRKWKKVYSTTSGQGGIVTVQVPKTPGRLVRMYGLKRSGQYGYSLLDIEVR